MHEWDGGGSNPPGVPSIRTDAPDRARPSPPAGSVWALSITATGALARAPTDPRRAGHGMAMAPRLALGSALLLAVTGCVHEEVAPLEAAYDDYEGAAEQVEARQITVDSEEAPAPKPVVTTPLSPDLLPHDPVPFKIGAGYGALSRVDFAPCREAGLPPGYLRVRATFARAGYVVRASVESTVAPPPPALDCIAAQLRQIGVPRFDTESASLSKSYFVLPGTPAKAAPIPQGEPAAM